MFSVPYNPIQVPTNPIGGTNISQLSSLKIGAGGEVMSVDNAGNASFGGELSAATGTFAGSLSAATGTFTGKVEIKDSLGNVVILIDPNG